jgi:integrase
MRGHLKKVGENKYRLVVYAGKDPQTGKKRQVWRTFTGTEVEADEALQRLVVETRDGMHAYPPGSLGDLLERWFAVAHLAPGTRQDYASAMRVHILPELGDADITRLRASDLDRFYGQLAERGLGPARIRRVHNILAVALGRAVTWREVGSNVTKDASPPPVTRREIRPPDTADIIRVLEVAAGTRKVMVKRKVKGADVEVPFPPRPAMVPYIYLGASTGARRSELCGIQWDDIDWDGKTVTIARTIVAVTGQLLVEPTKTRRVRRISLDSSTVMTLRGHRATCQEHADAWGLELAGTSFLFHREGDNTIPWRPDTTTDWFGEIRDAAGLPDLTIRQLRHYVATFLLGEGHDAVTVAGRLGHARPSTTTDVYSHFLPVKDRGAADTLGRALGG